MRRAEAGTPLSGEICAANERWRHFARYRARATCRPLGGRAVPCLDDEEEDREHDDDDGFDDDDADDDADDADDDVDDADDANDDADDPQGRRRAATVARLAAPRAGQG